MVILSPGEVQEFDVGPMSITVYPPGGSHVQVAQRGDVVRLVGLATGRALLGIGPANMPDVDFVARTVEVQVTE